MAWLVATVLKMIEAVAAARCLLGIESFHDLSTAMTTAAGPE